jgi:hypothetical protein
METPYRSYVNYINLHGRTIPLARIMTAHYATTAADDAVQANIVAAYGQ